MVSAPAMPSTWRRAGLKPAADQGFTLLELLVVLVVLALVAGVVASRFSPLSGSMVFKRQTGEMVSLLRYARGQAVATSRTVTVDITPDGTAYRIDPEEEFTPLSKGIQLSFKGDGPTSDLPVIQLRFHPDGTSSGGVLRLSTSKESANISIAWLTATVSLVE